MGKVRIGIVGTGNRAKAFIINLLKNENVEITALCDIDSDRLESFVQQISLKDVNITTDLEQFLNDDNLDAVIITVPDRFHKEVAIKAFQAGRHVMLEKPMALNVEDCRSIISAKEESGKILQIGFVLRSTPFYKKIKDIIDQGRFGQIMNITASEYLSVPHGSAYMRRWHRKKENSGSFILAKCSHDLDILCWLTGSIPTHVASFGDNNFFLPSKQTATHCSICPEKDTCQFKFDGGFVHMTEKDKDNPSENDFDLCVYNNDKDIVDNQVTIFEFENDIRGIFSLQLFYPGESKRFITINGNEAFLSGNLESGIIKIIDVKTGRIEEIDVSENVNSGHSGGDKNFTDEFVSSIIHRSPPVADLRDGFVSNVIASAIEKSRERKEVVFIKPSEYEI